MNELGILTTRKSHLTSVHTIHPVAAWIVGNLQISNPHFKPGYAGTHLQYGVPEMESPDSFPSIHNMLSTGGKD